MGKTLSQGPQRSSAIVIVGSGLFGLTFARLAAESGFECLVLEKRSHPGGNAWSELDPETGIEVHKYGSHLFHTSNERVWQFVNRFSSFNSYQHHVFTKAGEKVYRLPINLQTLNDFFGLSMSPNEAKDFLLQKTAPFQKLRDLNLESRAKSLVGNELYEAFFRGYTSKQWGMDPANLPAEIISRLPLRTSYEARYFKDKYEGLPTEGYYGLINRMLDHPKITLELNVDFFSVRHELDSKHPVIFTGPIDRYFDYAFGELSWRTLEFEWERHQVPDFQGCSVMKYADESTPWTRIHEFKHLHPERTHSDTTIICREFSRAASGPADEPYYPVNTIEDRQKLKSYRELASHETNVIFGGRLGSYQYLDMHMAIASAMNKFDNEFLANISN